MNKHLRKLVWKYRSIRQINFSNLAESAGYTNKSKWVNRICTFEREGIGEDDLIRRLVVALEIDLKELQQAVQKDYEEWEAWASEPVPMEMIVWFIGAVFHINKIPEEVSSSRELATEYARNYASENKLRVCLVLSRRESVWISDEGNARVSQTTPGVPNFPYASVGGKKFLLDLSGGEFRPRVLEK